MTYNNTNTRNNITNNNNNTITIPSINNKH